MLRVLVRRKEEILIPEREIFPEFMKREETKKAYLVLKELYRDIFDKELDLRKIVVTESGKPKLRNNEAFFNYSHSKRFIAAAIADREIGVDIEDDFSVLEEAAEIYLKDEKRNLREAWVLKEAFFKRKGEFTEEEFKQTKTEDIEDRVFGFKTDEYFLGISI